MKTTEEEFAESAAKDALRTEIVNTLLEAKLYNPVSKVDVDFDDVLQYLDEHPFGPALEHRLLHFIGWLTEER